jgi:hypothetical protein
MRFFEILLFVVLALAITVVVNLTGYGFTVPVHLSFELQSSTAADVRIFYKNESDDRFIRDYSVSFTAEQGDEYHSYEFDLPNLRSVSQLSLLFDDSATGNICIRNLTIHGYKQEFTYNFMQAVLSNISMSSSDQQGESACFVFYQRSTAEPAFSDRPQIISQIFEVHSIVEPYNYWQILFFFTLFITFQLIYGLIMRIGRKVPWRYTVGQNIRALLTAAGWIFVLVYIFGEIADAYALHNRLLLLGTLIVGLGSFFYISRGFFVRHAHFMLTSLVLILLMLVRYAVFKSEVGTIYHNEFMGYIHIVKQDLPFDVAAVLLISIACLLRRKSIRNLILASTAVGLSLMFLDYAINTGKETDRLIFTSLNFSKFTYQDFIVQSVLFFQTVQGLLTLVTMAMIVITVSLAYSRHKDMSLTPARLWSYLFIECLAVWAYFANIGTSSVYDDKFYNLVEVNRGIENLDFSRITASSSEINTVKQGMNSHKNVIVLVVNSLSSFGSRLCGGENLTPNIDVIANHNIWFKNYYALGYDDETANYSFLTGYPFLHNGVGLETKGLYGRALPYIMKNAGYATIMAYAFKPSSVLKVQYDNAGFDYLVDYMDSRFPETAPRYRSDSLDDKVFLEEMARKVEYWMRTGGKNFFVQIITGSGIAPFAVPVENRIDPSQKEYNFDKVMQFTDEAVAHFVQDLTRINYFRNGILIITGNHRASIPVSKKEYDTYGRLSVARVPLIIIDKNVKTFVSTNDISSASLGEIIQYLTLDTYSGSSLHVNPFIEKVNETIVYQELSPRNEILLKDGDNTGTFVIAGNHSEITGNIRNQDEVFGNILSLLRDTDTLISKIEEVPEDQRYKKSSEWFESADGDRNNPGANKPQRKSGRGSGKR